MKTLRKMALAAAVLALVTGLFVSCGAQGPEKVAVNFMEAVGNMDFEKAGEYTTEEGKQLMIMMSSMAEQVEESEAAQIKPGSIKVVSSSIDGDKATVVLSLDGEENSLAMKKVDGAWKVDLSKEDLQKEM